MMMQLNPALPIVTPKGKGLAQVLIDYGPEHDLIWVVIQDDGECWSWRNQDIRGERNITYNRDPA